MARLHSQHTTPEHSVLWIRRLSENWVSQCRLLQRLPDFQDKQRLFFLLPFCRHQVLSFRWLWANWSQWVVLFSWKIRWFPNFYWLSRCWCWFKACCRPSAKGLWSAQRHKRFPYPLSCWRLLLNYELQTSPDWVRYTCMMLGLDSACCLQDWPVCLNTVFQYPKKLWPPVFSLFIVIFRAHARLWRWVYFPRKVC